MPYYVANDKLVNHKLINVFLITENNNELKEIDIKNHTCNYFVEIIKIEDFYLYIILIDGKSYENILVYNISNKSFINSRSFRIRFAEIDVFIRAYDGTRYLVLFVSEKYDSIYNRTRHLINVKSGIPYIISHSYAKIKVDSYESLHLEKTKTFHDVITLINSVKNKDKNSLK